MTTALDSCVLLDILLNDARFASSSMAGLRQASAEGRLIVSDLVIAEISPVIPGQVGEFLADLEVEFAVSCFHDALEAGAGFGKYLANGGKGGRIVADFLIAAHAMGKADRLFTRDEGFQRSYWPDLEIWYP